MGDFGAKCPKCKGGNVRSLGRVFKGVDDIEEIEDTYLCEPCQIIFTRTGKISWSDIEVRT